MSVMLREPVTDGPLLRPPLRAAFPRAAVLVAAFFGVHAAIRFGGLVNPGWIPLSMVLVWPLPWLLSPRAGRRALGFRAPDRFAWFLLATAAALAALAVCALLAWGWFGPGEANWFTAHARTLREALERAPTGASPAARFWMVTAPAMIFSPLAEEFLYRGYMLTSFTQAWGERAGMLLQAAAFGLVHLAHYGLVPLQPALIVLWVPSMFGVALVLGWIVRRCGSLWPAVVAHAVFNLGMNAVVFAALPASVGI